MKYETYENQISHMMTRVYENGLTTTSGGNISVIDQERNIFITPGGIDKGALQEDDIVCIKSTGEKIGKHKPSVEFPFHQRIYEVRPEFNAIIHAHPPGIVAISAARKNPNTNLIKSIKKLISKTSLAAYALPGSQKLGENIAKEFEKGYDIIFLENHGVVIGAKDLNYAYLLLEALENFVQTEIDALSLDCPLIENDAIETSYTPTYYVPKEDELINDMKRKMIDYIKRSHRQKLFTSFYGCYSWRVNHNNFIIMPKDTDCMDLTEKDLIFVKDGKVESGKSVDENYRLHEDIYRQHPEINSIAIATPKHVMTFAITEKSFDSRIIPEGYILLKQVLKVKPDYKLLVKTISKQTPVVIVENNFVVVAGANLPQTFDRLEVLEYGAQTLLATYHYGTVVNISEDEIKEIDNHFNVW